MKKRSLAFISFLQAAGIVTYIILVSSFFWNANRWLANTPDNFLAPLTMLTLLSVSVSVCAILMFAYPVYLFWDEKKTKKSIKLVIYTTAWLIGFLSMLLVALFSGIIS